MDIASLAGKSIPGTQSSESATKLAENFDTFLQLLTSQLQNQDPLQPMDSTEFTQQLVQFSSVEQEIAQNQNLELLIALTQAATSGSAVSYLGKDVVADTDISTLENGSASWRYDLAATAEQVDVTVTDLNGKIVFTGTADGESRGTHDFTWDGRDNNGNPLPSGQYRLQVTAQDAAENAVQTYVTLTGKVDAVDFEDGGPVLTVGQTRVPIERVLSITEGGV